MLLLLLTLAAFTAGCSAHAEPEPATTSSSVADSSGDVVVGGPGLGDGLIAAADDTRTDIVNTAVDHRDDAVVFRVEFRELEPEQYLDVTADIRSDKSGSRTWQLTSVTYRGESRIDLYGPAGSSCPSAAVELDHAADTVTMTVPRSCLDDPAWIQAQVNAASMNYDARPGSRYADAVWEDDAYQEGANSGDRPFGPKLHHP